MVDFRAELTGLFHLDPGDFAVPDQATFANVRVG
jgi:hypothetical protein